MSNLRFKAVRASFNKKPIPVDTPDKLPSEYFGELTFTRAKMKEYLDHKTYEALIDCIDNGKPLSLAIADEVASGMKKWALEHGATHTTHWFQPLTDSTAEKHDSFLEYDGKGGMIEVFDGKVLIQQEPDASSFPNGGIRATFEARGYTAWDPTSPVFIQGDTLCIPTVFLAYTGEALDYKTPLKKSLKALTEAALPICELFDKNVRKVKAYLGWEQEFFLVDEELYAARTDLTLAGRTLMGHESSKSQQLDDHYMGFIPARVVNFMRELEIAAFKLGIPLKTRHNEVAPNQYEIAPIYGEMNLSNDQNQQVMNLMNHVARKHGFVVLLHEKPFAGINGSGKHNNWSLGTDTGVPLFAPGKDAAGNLQFLTFLVNTLIAVKRYNGLLKASIASSTNAHRLGASEAPPAIISVFLGQAMTSVLKKILEVPSDTPIEIMGKHGKKIGLVEIPEILIDNTDRNRTSPFAFTGNRFEFRAVGSSANCAGALTTLNAAVADQLTSFYASLSKDLSSGKDLRIAIMDLLKPMIKEALDTICFDGNGYTEEWKKEAEKRGLDTESCVPRMFTAFTEHEAVEMFRRTGVYTVKELIARNEVKWETYVKKVQIEARVIGRMAMNHVIPAALEYKTRLLKSVSLSKEIFPEEYLATSGPEIELAKEVSNLIAEIRADVDALIEARKKANVIEDIFEKALAYHEVADMIEVVRKPIDRLEELVDNDLWPLPKYRELLFIN
ncbi:glutamine synthetase III [bacterium]|nr:glutamine synthetase III [bacterium]